MPRDAVRARRGGRRVELRRRLRRTPV